MRFRPSLALLAAGAALGIAGPAHAQDRWTLNLGLRNGRVVADSTIGFTKGTPSRLAPRDSVILTVNCAPGVDCRRIGAQTRQTFVNGTSAAPVVIQPRFASQVRAEFPFSADMVAGGTGVNTRIEITSRDNPGTGMVEFYLLELGPAAPAPGPLVRQADTPAEPPADLRPLLGRDCLAQVTEPPGPLYDERGNRAEFLVTPVGNVLYRPPAVIDENDEVVVSVLGDPRLMPLLKVSRKSAIRPIGALNILGSGTSLTGLGLDRQALGAQEPPCVIYSYSLQDFAPGKGEVEIRALTARGSEVVGGFEFNVNKLYSGALSLGSMRTELEAPTYGLTYNGADSVVSVRSNGDFRMKYVLMYTHFVWGKRDTEKSDPNLLHHLNPSIGVVLDDIPNNWVGGITADAVEGVYLSFGVHAGRVKRLDPESGLSVGEKFTGNSTQIPTTQKWISKPFVSLTVDVRAAVELLRTALTGASSTAR